MSNEPLPKAKPVEVPKGPTNLYLGLEHTTKGWGCSWVRVDKTRTTVEARGWFGSSDGSKAEALETLKLELARRILLPSRGL